LLKILWAKFEILQFSDFLRVRQNLDGKEKSSPAYSGISASLQQAIQGALYPDE